MSKTKSKAILGFFSILIMMHHLSQRTSAAWVPDAFRRPGLGLFVPIGYLLVSFFFFCSGYGLIKSIRTKENYMTGFLVRRLNRLLMIFVLSQIIYLVVRFAFDAVAFPLNPYSWFVYTMAVLYVGFYLIYRKRRNCNLLLMALWILAYSVICYILVKGNWWINTSPVFLLGIYVADREDAILQRCQKAGFLQFVIPSVFALLSFLLAENANSIGQAMHLSYGIINLFQLVFQILSASAFSLFVYLLAVSCRVYDHPVIRVIRKVLLFYGAMTLEFYLIHGLFVQLFSHHFISDTTPAVCYIPNVFLYTVVVFILSSLAAFLLKKCGDLLTDLYAHSEIFQRFCQSSKRYFAVFLLLFVIFTVLYSLYRHNLSKSANAQLDAYRREYITDVPALGTEVATHAAGEGPYTLVFLGAQSDAVPTLSLRVLTDKLQDQYRCVIIDYPGKGFSPDTDDEKTADYYADLIHETLCTADEEHNLILIPHEISAIYAYRYIEKYPENVAGFVGLSALVPGVSTHFIDGMFGSVSEYDWYLKRIIRLNGVTQKFMVLTGFTGFQMPMFDYYFYGSGLKQYYPVMEEMFVRHYMQTAQVRELMNIYENCHAVEDFRMPKDLPVLFLLDHYAKTNDPYGVDWAMQYAGMITDPAIQSVEIINGDVSMVYYRAPVIAEKIELFLQHIQNSSGENSSTSNSSGSD